MKIMNVENECERFFAIEYLSKQLFHDFPENICRMSISICPKFDFFLYIYIDSLMSTRRSGGLWGTFQINRKWQTTDLIFVVKIDHFDQIPDGPEIVGLADCIN